MKALSEAISTIIIASTIVMVSITIFYLALLNIQQSVAMAEYGYIKSVMYGICTNIPDIIQGGTYGANLPSKLVGLGYKILSDNITIVISNQSGTVFNYTDTPIALEATIWYPVTTSSYTLYGVEKYVVNDTSLLPRLREYYYNKATYLVLDTNRVFVKIYKFEINGEIRYTINILYLKLNPIFLTHSPSRIVITVGGDIQNGIYSNISSLEIVYSNSSGNYRTSLSDLLPDIQPGDRVDVHVVVKELRVVVS